MNIVIAPAYEYLREWIENIPFSFDKGGRMIQDNRNVIKVFLLDNGRELNVKKFKQPHYINKIVYTFFRKSKAARAYHNSIRIAAKGFETPDAVAYMEMYTGGLLSDSFYISLQCRNVREIREYHSAPLAGNEPLIDAFARYSAALHNAGIYHLDYSPGNILFRDDTGRGDYSFLLVDVNRMKFLPVSFGKGCKNFARLFDNEELYKRVGIVYAQHRGNVFTPEKTLRLMLKHKERFLQKKKWKNRMKKMAPQGVPHTARRKEVR